MRDSMARGGPDDAGILVDGNIGLAHRRLSIIDLSPSGHQPMKAARRNVWVTYNGEIYNFPELKKELTGFGYEFSSTSDTEVLLNAYLQWGELAFGKFIGMFSFAVYDKDRSLFYLVRDHAGMKPLYYSIDGEKLVFASEVRAIKKLQSDWPENPAWRVLFLAFGHIPAPHTTLKNVLTLPKQSFFRLDLASRKAEIKRYQVPLFPSINSSDAAINYIREEFPAAIKRHLISDAPIGVFLSGGIDSSLIASLAHRANNGNLRTLSIVFNEKAYSEEEYQRILVDKLKCRHESFLVTEKDFLDALPDIFTAMDQPSLDGVNSYFISKFAAKTGLKAVLSGLGADELFGGYSSFARINKLAVAKKFPHLAGFTGRLAGGRFGRLSYLSAKAKSSLYLVLRGIFSEREISSLLSVSISEIHEIIRGVDFNEPAIVDAAYAGRMEADLYMHNQLLKDTDCMGMWHSLEIRMPFLDTRFASVVSSVDPSIKFEASSPKSLLLKSFAGQIPAELYMRSKMGFTFPFADWIANNRSIFTGTGGIPSGHWSKVWAMYVLASFCAKG